MVCFRAEAATARVFEHTVDQTAGEAVTATHAVDDRVDLVTLRLVELLAVVDHSFPAVEGSAVALAQRRNNILEAELLHHLLEDALVALSVGPSSSLPIHTSTYFINGRMIEIAFSLVHSFLRKFRSTETVTP